MGKLAPAHRSYTRAWIAGALAWLLALQGFGAAAAPYGHVAQSDFGQTIFQSAENCGAPHSGDPAAPSRHDHCACCVLCALGQDGVWLAALAEVSSGFAAFPSPRLEIARAERFPGDARKSLSGWTSSWSQRAPPRLS